MSQETGVGAPTSYTCWEPGPDGHHQPCIGTNERPCSPTDRNACRRVRMHQRQGKYSVSDLDRMRRAIRQRLSVSPTGLLPPMTHADTTHILEQREARLDLAVERQLVTYMMNGTTPDELEQEAAYPWRQSS